MGLSGHFTRMWTRCGRCKMLRQVVFWVELSVQRRLYPIFLSGVGLPRHPQVFRELTGCQRDTPDRGVTAWYQNLGIRIPRA